MTRTPRPRGKRTNRARGSVRRQGARDPHGSLQPPGYLHPAELSEQELHNRLVLDATTGVPTPLAWAVAAYTRIGQLSGKGPEAAYQRVREEARTITRGYGMPMG